uniref:Transposase n=1 Tax=Panagrolaimus superbus TaxID=310955 RepID=A0A914YUJ1_9BILA
MGGKKNTSLAIRKLILQKRAEGKDIRTISNEVRVPKSTVGDIIKKNDEGGPIHDKPRSGRPKKTTCRIDKAIVRKSVADPRKNAGEIANEINEEHCISISYKTAGRRLSDAGLNGRVPVKKPLISTKNRAARLRFAREHQHWTVEQWKKVLWSDESKFNLFGSDGKRYIRRPVNQRFNPRYQIPTVKHGGGSVMVWGAFHHGGVGPIVLIEGIMDKFVYRDLLQNNMLPFARRKMPRGWVFQQDNDPKHSSGLLKEWFVKKKLRVLKWPSQSPDLNPIEHLWDVLGRRVGAQKHSSKAQLFAHLEQEWSKIPLSTIHDLIESMPRRCADVIAAKGYATKY